MKKQSLIFAAMAFGAVSSLLGYFLVNSYVDQYQQGVDPTMFWTSIVGSLAIFVLAFGVVRKRIFKPMMTSLLNHFLAKMGYKGEKQLRNKDWDFEENEVSFQILEESKS